MCGATAPAPRATELDVNCSPTTDAGCESMASAQQDPHTQRALRPIDFLPCPREVCPMSEGPNVHPTTMLIDPLGEPAEIDVELVPLVQLLWCIGFRTISSCQGVGESLVPAACALQQLAAEVRSCERVELHGRASGREAD